MPTTRISSKHQITIPKEVFESANLKVGDILDATFDNGKVILAPKWLADKAPAARLSGKTGRALSRKYMKSIRSSVQSARGGCA